MRKIVAAVLVVVVVGLGRLSGAEAVSVSPSQLGDALIFPLFDVNNLHTLIAIENFSQLVNVYRVRFREEVSGVSVLSFDLCLTPTSTWTAAVFRDGSVTRVVSESRLLVNGSSTPLNTTLSPDATRGFIEVIGLRLGSFTAIAVCTDATLGIGVGNNAMGKVYYINPVQSPLLAYGMNALALKDFATVKIDDGTVLGNDDVARALILQGTSGSTSFGSRYFVDPAFGAETQVVMTFPTGPRSSDCLNCLIPPRLGFAPSPEDGLPLAGLIVGTGGRLVNVFTLTSSDIASPSGVFEVVGSTCFLPPCSESIPATGFVVQTTSAPLPGQPFFNVLFPLAIR